MVDARVYSGIHFRFADEAARTQARQVADWGFSHFMRPLNGESVATSQVMNMSARGMVQAADDVMIGGFIIDGSHRGDHDRARDRTVSAGRGQARRSHSLELFDRNGASIGFNDNWADTQQPEIVATGIPPNDQRESAIVRTFAPGPYTAVVRGMNQTMGIALVEVYALP